MTEDDFQNSLLAHKSNWKLKVNLCDDDEDRDSMVPFVTGTAILCFSESCRPYNRHDDPSQSIAAYFVIMSLFFNSSYCN